ncbi:hypothetical protein CABS01_04210 [Colletotrichum abscissum]|nr:uncharacterized protein CABS01_04210 [Colletotrichum abscissum]KAK1473548.1 hypothetical protein CABS01_04210 [Colletotrichum abscissum]
MASYVYTELQATIGDLRLVILQPGSYRDELRCNILHYPLLEPKEPFKDERLPVSELQKTLPDGWTVDQTLDGRYLFMSPRHSGIPNSWKHPDPEYDSKAYAMPEHSVSDIFAWHVPPYEALSYSWGTANDEEFIHITDPASTHNTPAWLRIRKNLATALRHLRYADQPRTLWIDAICINQANVEERGRQVKRMSQIYPLSEKVIIWLGSEFEDSKHALETLEYFSKQVEYVISHRWGDAPNAEQLDWWRDDVPLPWKDRTWKSISSLLHRPWFERVWVLQEALLCDRVVLQCGRDAIAWVDVRKALLVLRQKSSLLPDDIRRRLFPYARGLMAPPLASCEHLLLWTRNQQCSDPRDKVYGILGLMDPRIVAKIEVDYSFPPWKTFAQLVLAEHDVYQKLNMINNCGIATRPEGCPSWVPNLEQPIEGANIGYLSIRRFYASARSSAVVKLIEPADHLQVTGRRVAIISRVSDDLNGTFVQLMEVVRDWAPKDPQNDMYVSGGLSMDAYVEVLVRGDQVAVILGCDFPLILRPGDPGRYEVVGPCFVHGLMLGEALKPPLKPPWKDALPVTKGWAMPYFINTETLELMKTDVRLGSLPLDWEEVASIDPFLPPFVFKNKNDGRISVNDPRMSVDAIQKRGIELETLVLT